MCRRRFRSNEFRMEIGYGFRYIDVGLVALNMKRFNLNSVGRQILSASKSHFAVCILFFVFFIRFGRFRAA